LNEKQAISADERRKTDQRNMLLEMGREGKLSARSSGWDENPVFLEDDNEVPVKNGR
jgi:hypothetical protein